MNDNDNALDPVPANIPTSSPSPSVSTFDLADLDIVHLPPDEGQKSVATSESSSLPQNIGVEHSQESTRSQIALMFTRVFLIIIGIAFAGPFVINIIDPTLLPNPTEISKTLVTEVASVLAGPFGFIVGFYFKQGNTK